MPMSSRVTEYVDGSAASMASSTSAPDASVAQSTTWTPLPVAEVVPKQGEPPVTGDFVGEDGGVWYVADFETDDVRAFNLLNTEEASFSSRERDHTTLLDAFD